MEKYGDGRDWFFEKRFGLFIHWGIYSINGWHEQEQYLKGLSREQYQPLAKRFNPVKFNPDQWLDMAGKAGMEYICFTAKHIDGFCMWDTAQTDFKITATPYGRDVLAMLAEACARRNFPLCIYYAVPDQNCPYYPHQGRRYEFPSPPPGDEPDTGKFLSYIKAQVTEICTRYGKIHGFWWDANAFWGQALPAPGLLKIRDKSINRLVRSLQPGIIINNRGFDRGDFATAERASSEHVYLKASRAWSGPMEACESIGRRSWGYRKNEDYFSVGSIRRGIARNLSRGYNYLLNIGPRADGTFPPRGVHILEQIADWYPRVREALVGVRPVPNTAGNDGFSLARRGDTLYVHAPGLETSGLVIETIGALPRRATLLNSGAAVKASLEMIPTAAAGAKPCLHLHGIPVDELANDVAILKLEFAKLPPAGPGAIFQAE